MSIASESARSEKGLDALARQVAIAAEALFAVLWWFVRRPRRVAALLRSRAPSSFGPHAFVFMCSAFAVFLVTLTASKPSETGAMSIRDVDVLLARVSLFVADLKVSRLALLSGLAFLATALLTRVVGRAWAGRRSLARGQLQEVLLYCIGFQLTALATLWLLWIFVVDVALEDLFGPATPSQVAWNTGAVIVAAGIVSAILVSPLRVIVLSKRRTEETAARHLSVIALSSVCLAISVATLVLIGTVTLGTASGS